LTDHFVHLIIPLRLRPIEAGSLSGDAIVESKCGPDSTNAGHEFFEHATTNLVKDSGARVFTFDQRAVAASALHIQRLGDSSPYSQPNGFLSSILDRPKKRHPFVLIPLELPARGTVPDIAKSTCEVMEIG